VRQGEKRQLELEIEELTRQKRQVEAITEDAIKEHLEDIKASIASEDVVTKRNALNRVVEKIEVGHKSGMIYYKDPTSIVEHEVWSMPPTGFEPVSQP
jgi:hypothetical protein